MTTDEFKWSKIGGSCSMEKNATLGLYAFQQVANVMI